MTEDYDCKTTYLQRGLVSYKKSKASLVYGNDIEENTPNYLVNKNVRIVGSETVDGTLYIRYKTVSLDYTESSYTYKRVKGADLTGLVHTDTKHFLVKPT